VDSRLNILFNLFTLRLFNATFHHVIAQTDPDQLGDETPMGLVTNHAYAITSVKMMDINTPENSEQISMIRIRNPWGNEAEWKGAWSDQ
jgi:calpain